MLDGLQIGDKVRQMALLEPLRVVHVDTNPLNRREV